MKFNIGMPPKDIQQRNKSRIRREWHEKFAWIPTHVDETDTSYSVVWFEKYMRREKFGPTSPVSRSDGAYWEKYSSKTYFKKQLNGDFDKGDSDTNASTTTLASSVGGSGSFRVQRTGGGAISAVHIPNKPNSVTIQDLTDAMYKSKK